MIALYILLCLFLVLGLLCFVKLKFTAQYTDSLSLRLKVLFLKFTLVPAKKKSKKQKKKIPKKKKEQSKKTAKKEKKPSKLKKLSDKKGLSGLLSMLSEIVKLIGTTAKGIYSNIVIEKLDLDITIVGTDAADTALKYGKLCGVFYSAVSVICDNVKEVYDYNIDIKPDFDDEAKGKIFADTKLYIRTFYVLKYALKALFKMLVIRYRR